MNHLKLAAVTILLLGTLALGKNGVVTTKDNKQLKGDITETNDGMVLIKDEHKIEYKLDRRGVAKIEYVQSVEDQFTSDLAKLNPKDAAGRVALARGAFENHRYDLARKALEEAMKIDPANKPAADLLDMIERTEDLERKANRKPATTQTAPGVSPIIEKKVLTADDINLIRQMELTNADDSIRVTFDGDVLKRYFTRSNDDVSTFNRLSNGQKIARIFSLHDPSLNRQVRIRANPAALNDFRNVVQPIVVNNCATAGCHGGDKGGSFVLYPSNEMLNESKMYTNFYVLQTYSKTIDGVKYQMFDRNTAEQSLILNYILPPALAKVKHPAVEGFKPILRDNADKRYATLYDFIRNLKLPEPDYGIQFPLAPAPPVVIPPLPGTQPSSGK